MKTARLSGSIKIFLKEKSAHWVADKMALCGAIVGVVNKYVAKGYTLTLRQLYYQLVAGEVIPNHDKVYKKLSSILGDLRMCGQLDWGAIEDRGRVPYLKYWVHGIQDALKDAAGHYRLRRQSGQDVDVEVWTEKDAISGILKRVTDEFHVRLVVNKGYSSASAMYKAYRRFVSQINQGQKVVILYFGDHDPSGLDMIRDIRDRITTFLAQGDLLDDGMVDDWWEYCPYDARDVWQTAEEADDSSSAASIERVLSGDPDMEDHDAFDAYRKRLFLRETESFEVVPIGLTMDQIRDFEPPPNPAKLTDPRAKWYIKKFGAVSWEVDAIEPDLMIQIVTDGIVNRIDMDQYRKMLKLEKEQILEIKRIASSYKEEE